MNTHSVLALVAATFSAALAVAAACRGRRSLATWCFSAGMLSFALESLFGAMWLAPSIPERAAFWGGLTLVTKSFLPGIWLCFSFTYSRGGSRGFPVRSRFLVLAALLVPVGVSLLLREQLAPVFPQSDVGRNLVDSLSCGGQNTERLFAGGHGAGSYESGEGPSVRLSGRCGGELSLSFLVSRLCSERGFTP